MFGARMIISDVVVVERAVHDSFVRKVLSALEGLSEGPWF